MREITPCLWFDTEGEDAAKFYTSMFPRSRITDVARYGSAGPRPEGTAITVSFELDGRKFLALNGGAAVPLHRGGLVPGQAWGPARGRRELSQDPRGRG